MILLVTLVVAIAADIDDGAARPAEVLPVEQVRLERGLVVGVQPAVIVGCRARARPTAGQTDGGVAGRDAIGVATRLEVNLEVLEERHVELAIHINPAGCSGRGVRPGVEIGVLDGCKSV